MTGYEDVYKVLTNRQFGMRPVPMHRGRAPAAVRVSRILRLDGAEHRRIRNMLMRGMDARGSSFIPHVEAAVRECLDGMEQAGPPADLVAVYASRVPLLVTCRLLGLPFEDREIFHAQGTAELFRIGSSSEASGAFAQRALDYIGQVVADRLDTPKDDLISDLLVAGEFSADEVTENIASLLIAGYEAPAGMLSKGAAVLMDEPALLTVLGGEAKERSRLVEELLRYISIIQYGVDRVALEDVQIGGQHIAQGEAVIALLPAANHDPHHAPHPDTVNVTSSAVRHLAFGHGAHSCLGQQLSRVMLDIALRRLFEQFPTLHPVENLTDYPQRDGYLVGGYIRLEVAW
ncbi:cytochrome P450 [Streptomyces formicae]|uniref:Cytochrome P450 n=1 Tax=Streptomyces formicae TaxID=1616117 RepID=A0ABY3WHA1_9ACTN|nr:cytochrome P450 [Streptomyces formicae]UNM11006.1 cytochrome P450 [Streptomyces formicae]